MKNMFTDFAAPHIIATSAHQFISRFIQNAWPTGLSSAHRSFVISAAFAYYLAVAEKDRSTHANGRASKCACAHHPRDVIISGEDRASAAAATAADEHGTMRE